MPPLKQTTALQDIKERLQVMVDDMKAITNWEVGYRTAMQNVIKDIDAQGLDKERQDLINAFEGGYSAAYKGNGKTGNDYFTNTFNQ